MRLMLLCIIAIALAGCGATICPPPHPDQPVAVFVADYGKHSSLILPADHGFSEYAYGDWDWFVLNRSRPSRVFQTMLFSKHAALGKRDVTDPHKLLVPPGTYGAKTLLELDVDANRAARLKSKLDDDFQKHIETKTYNPEVQLDFVRADQHYWLLHNCNTVVANWLSELGCNVAGSAITSKFRLADRCR
jgi:hypothetical protein